MPKSRQDVLIVLCTLLVSSALLRLPYTPALAVRTAVVEEGELIQSVLVSGVVAYAHQQPCLTLQPGVVSRVHVKAGQQVIKGELLFEMDASAHVEALAALYGMKHELEAGGWALLSAQQRWEWAKTEGELKQAVAASRIRAEQDGVVEAVYISPGDYAEAGAVLGYVRNGEKCIVATGRAADLTGVGGGSAAALEQLGAAVVDAVHAPDETGMQQLVLLPSDAALFDGRRAGERITAEVVTGMVDGCALIPLSAVDGESRVWVVENGCAHAYKVDVKRRSAQMTAVDPVWKGRRVILSPTQELTEGCRVKEAKGQ